MMLLEQTSGSVSGEAEARRRIDLAVGRAIADPEFAATLLADPTVAFGEAGCTPQQYLQLRGIRAHDLREFASQAEALFWPVAYRPGPERAGVALASGF